MQHLDPVNVYPPLIIHAHIKGIFFGRIRPDLAIPFRRHQRVCAFRTCPSQWNVIVPNWTREFTATCIEIITSIAICLPKR